MTGYTTYRTGCRRPWRTVAVTMVCLVTFFVNNHAFMPDIMESRNIITAREMVYDGHWIVTTMNGDLRMEKPPLPTWLAAVAEMAAPDNISLQRAMAGLAALLLVFYFHRFAERILDLDPLLPTLLLCTCYSVVLMGRTASWDIYCHAFMMGGIYHLARALLAPTGKGTGQCLAAGLLAGLSILSKGPVSLYALLLPFLLTFAHFIHPTLRGKWGALFLAIAIALAVGTWWYIYVYISHGDDMAAVVQKESGSWLNHNVRPWWYYWKFFLETGAWSLLLITAILLPIFDSALRWSRRYMFAIWWMLISLILLSLLPEKKSRYLLPLTIPACLAMGCLMSEWLQRLRAGRLSTLHLWAFRINAGLIAVATAILPVAAWLFLLRAGLMSWTLLGVLAAICLAVAVYITSGIRSNAPLRLLYGVTALFLAAECLALPCIRYIVNNPEMKSIALTREMRELDGIPFYHDAREPLRIELVYAANKKIRPFDLTRRDSLLAHLPCALLTRKPIGEALPAPLLDGVDTVHIGLFDDNRRPKGNHRRYSNDFIYNITLLRLNEQDNKIPPHNSGANL